MNSVWRTEGVPRNLLLVLLEELFRFRQDVLLNCILSTSLPLFHSDLNSMGLNSNQQMLELSCPRRQAIFASKGLCSLCLR